MGATGARWAGERIHEVRSLELVLACWLLCCSSGGTEPSSPAVDEPASGAGGAAMTGAGGAMSKGGSAGNTIAMGAAGVGGAADAAGGTSAGGGAGTGGRAGTGGGGTGGGDAGLQVRTPTHVACIGDSITYGAGNISHPYPSNLQTLLGTGVKVQNFGVSGTTILSTSYGPYVKTPQYQAATDFVAQAGAASVVDVVIMLGTNDSARDNWTPDGKPKNDQRFLAEYGAMVDHFAALPTHPLVFLVFPTAVGMVPVGVLISGKVIHDEEIPLIKQLATEKGLPTIDANTPTTNHPEYFMSDNIHPNDAGYVALAQIIYDGLTLPR
jgi:lysophospholipase L1-like esterase